MRKSIEIVNSFDEDKILPIPGVGDSDITKLLCALHIEKRVFAKDGPEMHEASEDIFKEFNIQDGKLKDKLLEAVCILDEFLENLISKLYGKENLKESGEFTYPEDGYLYKDENNKMCVNLEKLQSNETKYDGVNLFSDQVIIKFNVKNKEITVNNKDIEIPPAEDNIPDIMNIILGNVDKEEDRDEEEKKDYSEWNNFISECKDRDVVLIYQDGEEVGRF